MSFPKTAGTWRVQSTSSGFDGVVFEPDSPIPDIGDNDCLVKIKAASLNFRDIMIPQGDYPFPLSEKVIPGSDGAGTVVACGKNVTRFKVGDNVCTTLNQGHLYGPQTPQTLTTGLGGSLDGTLREYGVFNEQGLVSMPASLSIREASTLTCAAVTAWNALYGLKGRPVRPGDHVLTLGTGGVSIFAIQFAVAAGAVVIATTSSDEKGKKLKDLGVRHVINYRDDQKWGETAKQLTPAAQGVDFVIEVGGPSTLKQSLAATRMDGLIAVVGVAGGMTSSSPDGVPSFLDAWLNNILVRGISVGSREEFERMNQAIETSSIKPVLDGRTFGLREVREAYQHLADKNHFGKVVIDCSQ